VKLIFIRHGDPDYVKDCLTQRGRIEAEALQPRVAGWPKFDVYQSPLGRAQETARLALQGSGLTPQTLPWLEEFRGRLPDGKICWDLAPSVYAADPLLIDPVRWTQAETYCGSNVEQIHKETVSGLDALLENYGYRRRGRLYGTRNDTRRDAVVVLFCHMAITMDCLSHLLNLAAPTLWQQTFLPPASVTVVGTEEQEAGWAQWRTQGMGDTSHLRAAGIPLSTVGYFAELFPG
jgi:probable phosphoglycerate mutase